MRPTLVVVSAVLILLGVGVAEAADPAQLQKQPAFY
jgi:hypothetical protein